MRRSMGKNKTMRGRPRLNITLNQILEAVHRHGQIVGAARELGCSQAYVHARMKEAGLTLREVLEAADIEAVLLQQEGDH